jgi:hypothetical protein
MMQAARTVHAGPAQQRQSAAFSLEPALSDASTSAPSPAALHLGRAGLLPFVFGALASWFVQADWRAVTAAALTAYGALIVSFLGGIHWGLALRQAPPRLALLGWGVMPSLLAWPALLLPPAAGLVWLAAMLVACYAVDHRVYPAQGAAAWLGLRRQLTVVASLSCFLAAGGIATGA